MVRLLLSTIPGLLAYAAGIAAPNKMNLSLAIKQHIVSVTAEATGNSYMQQGLKLTIKNTGSLDFIVVVDKGAVFAPEQDEYQPLITAGEESAPLKPLKEVTLSVQTFCANSSKSAPVKGILYRYEGPTRDSMLLSALAYLKQNRLYNSLGQSAVWMFTNGHSLNSVYDREYDVVSQKLVEFLANLTGKPLPEYYLQNDVSALPGQPVYQPKPLKIFANFNLVLDAPAKLTLGVYNEENEIVQPVFENRQFGKAGHKFRVEFESRDVPAGNYYIRLKEGATTLREATVNVE